MTGVPYAICLVWMQCRLSASSRDYRLPKPNNCEVVMYQLQEGNSNRSECGSGCVQVREKAGVHETHRLCRTLMRINSLYQIKLQ